MSSNLIHLNQKEVKESKKCNCRGKCQIFHKIYNFKFSYYQSIVQKFRNLYSCSKCGERFDDSGSQENHVKNAHCRKEEEKNGEIEQVELQGGD